MSHDFLVYEHWRPDTGKCFYVGKGKKRRSHSFEPRNSRYGRIIKKLRQNGFSPEIRIVRQHLTETEAFELEIATISLWRARGIEIANYTNGGDGASGYTHTAATKKVLRQKAIGRKRSPEMRELRSKPRAPHSSKTRAKMSASAKVAQKKRFDKVKGTKKGRAELRRRMLALSRKAASDPELRARRSANAKALWADPAYREKMRNRRVSRSVVEGFS